MRLLFLFNGSSNVPRYEDKTDKLVLQQSPVSASEPKQASLKRVGRRLSTNEDKRRYLAGWAKGATSLPDSSFSP
jgi:hypothetical protein